MQNLISGDARGALGAEIPASAAPFFDRQANFVRGQHIGMRREYKKPASRAHNGSRVYFIFRPVPHPNKDSRGLFSLFAPPLVRSLSYSSDRAWLSSFLLFAAGHTGRF